MIKILLAEDNPVNQMITKKIVEKLGTQVDVAVNGREAVEKVQQSEYDMVLMDVNMPVMNGIEASRQIRSLGFSMPIVALTADSDNFTHDLKECGMTDLVSKPINISKIETIINTKIIRLEKSQPCYEDTKEGCIEYVFTQMGLEREIVEELVGEFVTDSEKHLKLLEENVSNGAIVLVASEAHYIKGAAKNMGLKRIAEAAEKLESCARNNEPADYTALLKDLSECLLAFQKNI
jgi:CheY-like chemotaxis protein/HPt (histidine-containing phosphotransfer) domain-containing protein